MKYLFCFILFCSVIKLSAQDRSCGTSLYASATFHPVKLRPLVFNYQPGINLQLKASQHPGFFKLPFPATHVKWISTRMSFEVQVWTGVHIQAPKPVFKVNDEVINQNR